MYFFNVQFKKIVTTNIYCATKYDLTALNFKTTLFKIQLVFRDRFEFDELFNDKLIFCVLLVLECCMLLSCHVYVH